MQRERSCGAVVFCIEGGQPRYLLVRSQKGIWGFPKGHMRKRESEHDTALREIKEETGVDVSFIDGFRTFCEYPLERKNRPDALKTVIYYLAKFEGQCAAPQDLEISETALMDYDSAMNALQYENLRKILNEANSIICVL